MSINTNPDALAHEGAVATIIPESEHPIREHQLDREALKVLYRLRDAGFKGYLVGGGVRDLYLGKEPKDFDVSTDARPGELRKLFRNSRTIGRRFRLVQVFFRGNKIIEVSTLRSQNENESDETDQVLAANNTFGSLEEDAFRRDLTINSLFYEVGERTVIDYVGGVDDLNRGVIRMVGDPDRRFTRDPVRMMRAVRHAARTGFIIEASTFEAIKRQGEKLLLCPPSRLRDEILKDLQSGMARPWAERCLDTDLWFTLFPFYSASFEGIDGEKTKSLLLRLLAELDTIFQGSHGETRIKMEEYFLFAVLLLPWVAQKFDIPGSTPLRGLAFQKLLASLRKEIDRHFGVPFNVARMAKERIATLIMNLSTLQHTKDAKGGHPKWLKKKSYYRDCNRLHNLLQLSLGEEVAALPPEEFIDVQKNNDELEVLGLIHEGNSSTGKRGRGAPAFASTKHGVFGLRTG